jgi:hypothetical protein
MTLPSGACHHALAYAALVALALLAACGKAPGPESTWTRVDGPTFTAELAAGQPADAPRR